MTAGRLAARRIAGSAERLGAGLWLAVGLAANPRAYIDGWTVVLPRGEAPWHDEWGRPSEPAAAYAEQASVAVDVAENVLGCLEALAGLATTSLVMSAARPTLVLYDSALTLGPWAAGAHAASGVYFAGIVGLSAAATGGTRGQGHLPSHQLETTVAHELAHWYLDVVTSGAMPRWLSEGMALRAEERYLGASVPVALLRERAHRAGPGTIADVVGAFGLSTHDLTAEAGAYQLARSFVAYLDDPASGVAQGWEGRLATALGGGEAFEQAIFDALGLELGAVERSWAQWLP